MSEPVRVAMWSGPRNISTAMMRSWGSRADTSVCDEPFYARYLKATGADHPGRDEIIARHETDERRILDVLLGPVPAGRAIYYQKHMTHHVLPGDDLSWTSRFRNAFLIRDPAEMIVSFIKVVPDPRPDQLGLPRQLDLFERERARLGRTPPVVDARDVQDRPRETLGALCEALDLPFDDAMLRWDPGPRDTDGVWARHWYSNVYRTCGFEPHRAAYDPVPARLAAVHARCRDIYSVLHAARIRA